MTRQESFKRRIRERMAKTGERYGAARRVLIEQAAHQGGRPWVAEPELSDESIREATGRGWDDWCDVIDAWPGHDDGHTAIASYLVDEHGINGWWAQSVTVGYERITGRRLRHQRPDGTFSAGKTRTIRTDAKLLREMLLDEDGRADLFPHIDTELRSRPTSKNVRLAVGPGIALIDLRPREDGRVTVAVAHEQLPDAGAVEAWKAFWETWLEALDEA